MLAAKLLSTRRSVEFINTQSTQRTTNSTTIVINAPTGIVAGNLLVAYVCMEGTGLPDNGWTAPSGWTIATGTADGGRAICWKIATGSEPANYTFTATVSSTSYGFIAAFRNAAFDTTSAWSAQSSTYPQTITGISVSDGAYVLFACTQVFYASISYTLSTSGWSSFITDNDATPPSSAWFYKANVVGSTGDVVVASATNNRINRSAFVSIKPA